MSYPKNKKNYYAFFLSFLFLTTACVKRIPPRSSIDANTYAHLQTELRDLQQGATQRFSGLAQVRIEAHGHREFFDIAAIFEAPDQLVLEVMDDLGQRQMSLKADGEQVFWQDFQSGSSEYFPQEGDALKKALGLPLSVEDFIAGVTQRLDLEEPALQISNESSGQSSNVLQIDRLSDQICLDTATKKIQRFSVRKKIGSKTWRYQIDYRDYRLWGVKSFPREIEWNFSKPKVSILIQWTDIEIKK